MKRRHFIKQASMAEVIARTDRLPDRQAVIIEVSSGVRCPGTTSERFRSRSCAAPALAGRRRAT